MLLQGIIKHSRSKMNIEIKKKKESITIENKYYPLVISKNLWSGIALMLIGSVLLLMSISLSNLPNENLVFEKFAFYSLTLFILVIGFYTLYSLKDLYRDKSLSLLIDLDKEVLIVNEHNFEFSDTKFYSEWKRTYGSRINPGYEYYRIYLTDDNYEFVFEIDVKSFVELVEATAGKIKFIKESY